MNKFEFSPSLPHFDIYLVGGFIRDHFLGVKSKDLDLVCEAGSFLEMKSWIEKTHKEIYLESPEFFTIRAKGLDGLPYDYVLARKEGAYSDGRHPDEVSAGTILDDLSRRDFTANAIAFDIKRQELYDPFCGSDDIRDMVLKCVGSTEDRLTEDPLRIIRAMRFCLTKGFKPSSQIMKVFRDPQWAKRISDTVSQDRIREELTRCFIFDSVKTMEFIFEKMSPEFRRLIFREKNSDGLWLAPTSRKK